MLMSWPQNVPSASGVPPYTITHHQTRSPLELKGTLILPQTHGCEIANRWIESHHPARRPSTTYKYSSKLARLRPPRFAWSWPPGVSRNPLNYGHQSFSIMASGCISKLPRLWPPNCSIAASKFVQSWPSSTYLQTGSNTASKWILKLAWSLPPSASLNLLKHSLKVYLQIRTIPGSKVRMIMAANFIYTLTQSRSHSASLSSLQHGLQVYLQLCSIIASNLCISQTRSITASECIAEFTQWSFSGAPPIPLKQRLWPVQIYFVWMGSYIDT